MKHTVLFAAIASLAVSACGDGKGEIAECKSAVESIETACAKSGLSEGAQKTCATAKKAIATLEQAADKTGKSDIAAQGCQKQAEIVARVTGKSATQPTTAAAKPTGAEPKQTAPKPKEPVASSGSRACARMASEVAAACGKSDGFNKTQTLLCKTARKSAGIFTKMAAKNPAPAAKGCAKTLEGWSKRGGLVVMVERAGR